MKLKFQPRQNCPCLVPLASQECCIIRLCTSTGHSLPYLNTKVITTSGISRIAIRGGGAKKISIIIWSCNCCQWMFYSTFIRQLHSISLKRKRKSQLFQKSSLFSKTFPRFSPTRGRGAQAPKAPLDTPLAYSRFAHLSMNK